MRYGRCRAVRLKHDARRASADSGGSSMPGGERATRARLAGPPVLALYRLAVAVPVSAWLAAGTAGWGGRLPGLSLAQAAGWVLVLVLFELLPAPRRGGPGLRVTFAAQVAIALLYPAQVAATLAFLGGVEARPLRRRGSPLGTWSHHAEQALVTALGSATFRLLATFHAPWPRLLAASLATALLMHAAATALLAVEERLAAGTGIWETLVRLERASPWPFPSDVPGMGWFGLPAAHLYLSEGFWPMLVLLGLLWYARKKCLQTVDLADRLAVQNELLASQSQELRTHLAREQQTVAELQRLNRMHGQFVAMASHEVRTPLTAIIGYATTLRRFQVGGDPRLRATFLDIIERQARRLLALVPVAALCKEAVEALGAAGGQVRLSLPPDLPPLLTDRRYLGQVLGNLLENAVKYSTAGSACELGASQDGAWLALWVRDRGSGIPQAELGRIFDRFYQVDASDTRAAAGVGLGLSLVQDLVHLLGGTVSVSSRVGEGSQFTVRLPLTRAEAPGTAPAVAERHRRRAARR